MRRLAAALAAACAAHAWAEAPEDLRIAPGRWKVEISGVAGAPNAAFDTCVREGRWPEIGRLVARLRDARRACEIDQYAVTGSLLTWAAACAATGLQASGRFQIAPEAIEGETAIVENGAARRVGLRATREGDC